MNQINPAKLLNSKWTAVKPLNREKHFLVSEIEFDEEGLVVLCKLKQCFQTRNIQLNGLNSRIKTNGFKVGNSAIFGTDLTRR